MIQRATLSTGCGIMSRCKEAAIALMDVMKEEIHEAVDVVSLKRTSTEPFVYKTGNGLYEEITIVIGVVRKNALEV